MSEDQKRGNEMRRGNKAGGDLKLRKEEMIEKLVDASLDKRQGET